MPSAVAHSHATVVSVNVGEIREVVWRGRPVRTGIWKSPVGDRRIGVSGVNLAGDDQADRTVHGGPYKSVYAYAVEDYHHWRAAGREDAAPALFGENLTTRGIDLRKTLTGARWRIGTALLEVTQPRLPCFKLDLRLGEAAFSKRFLAEGRLGAYLRIVEPGELGVGDVVTVIAEPQHGVTLAMMAAALRDAALASEVLAVATIPPSWRDMLSQRVP